MSDGEVKTFGNIPPGVRFMAAPHVGVCLTLPAAEVDLARMENGDLRLVLAPIEMEAFAKAASEAAEYVRRFK